METNWRIGDTFQIAFCVASASNQLALYRHDGDPETKRTRNVTFEIVEKEGDSFLVRAVGKDSDKITKALLNGGAYFPRAGVMRWFKVWMPEKKKNS